MDLGTVKFSAGSTQTITGATNFYHVEVDNTSGVNIIANNHTLQGAMTLTNGIFNTNNALTVLSNSSGTGAIGAINAGSDLLGDIIMQRFIPQAITSWRFLSTPIQGKTLADWNDDFFMSGFTGSDLPTYWFKSIYRYNESDATPDREAATSYIAATNITDPILTDEAYWCYVGPSALTFDVDGTINKGAQTANVSYTPSGLSSEDGWCLVPNPYPSAIDWDATSGWTKTNVNDAVYVWNPSNQQYSAYIAGAGVNGGTRYVPSSQGFYVQTNAAGPVLSMAETVKAPKQQPTYKNATPAAAQMIRLEVTGVGGAIDELVVRFHQDGTDAFESELDATKLASFESAAPTFSSVGPSNDFAINTLAPLETDRTVQLRLQVGVAGTYTITATDFATIPTSSCLMLEDFTTGTVTDLRTSNYTFTIPVGVVAPRFNLHIGAPFEKEIANVSCNGFSDGEATATGTGAGPWNYVWADPSGTVIQTTNGSTVEDVVSNLPYGIYTVTISGLVCGTLSEEVVVQQPAAITTNFTTHDVSCFGLADAKVETQTTGGTGTYIYEWSNGETSKTIEDLTTGDYTVRVIDRNGCEYFDTVIVNEPVELVAQATTTDEFDGCDGEIEIKTIGGTTPYTYMWVEEQVSTTQGTLTALCEGNYTVLVTDKNTCQTTLNLKVYGLEEVISTAELLVYPNPTSGQFTVNFELEETNDATIQVINMLGEILSTQTLIAIMGSYSSQFDLSNQPTGMYMVRLIVGNDIQVARAIRE